MLLTLPRRCALVAGIVALLALPVGAQDGPGPLVVAKQGSFFVGGRDTHSDTLSTVPDFAPIGTITVDQMYVRYHIPVDPKGRAIILIHGCRLTAKTWGRRRQTGAWAGTSISSAEGTRYIPSTKLRADVRLQIRASSTA